MADDKGTGPAHTAGTRKGEELTSQEGTEEGRVEKGGKGADRPAGGSTGRFSTSINPDKEDPIDPESPYMPAP